MLSWLNANSGAVQAIAAVVVALGTIALVIVTRRYVRLTRDLTETTRAELQIMRDERARTARERRAHIKSIVEHLRAITAAFPMNRAQMEEIRGVPLWDPTQPAELFRLAVAEGPEIAVQASEAARYLALLHQLASEVQETLVTVGYEWSRFPFERWGKARDGAERCLNSVRTLIERQRSDGEI